MLKMKKQKNKQIKSACMVDNTQSAQTQTLSPILLFFGYLLS